MADVLWRDEASTALWLWPGRADGTYAINYLRDYPAGCGIAGIGDFNGDGWSDILWHTVAGQGTQISYMNRATWMYGVVNPISSQYRVAGVGDVIAGLTSYGATLRARRYGSGRQKSIGGFGINCLRACPAGWDVAGIGDFNGHGRADIFWHSISQERTQTWLMTCSNWTYLPVSVIPNQYRVAAVGDFNGDGLADVLWRDEQRTALWQWQMRPDGGQNIVYVGTYPQGWEVVN